MSDRTRSSIGGEIPGQETVDTPGHLSHREARIPREHPESVQFEEPPPDFVEHEEDIESVFGVREGIRLGLEFEGKSRPGVPHLLEAGLPRGTQPPIPVVNAQEGRLHRLQTDEHVDELGPGAVGGAVCFTGVGVILGKNRSDRNHGEKQSSEQNTKNTEQIARHRTPRFLEFVNQALAPRSP